MRAVSRESRSASRTWPNRCRMGAPFDTNASFSGLLKKPIEEEVTPAPPPGFGFWSSFRRRSRPMREGSTESIFAFAFSPPRSDGFISRRGGSESNAKTKGEFTAFRIRTPRNNEVVAAPPGEKSKWIPAFAGMTASCRTGAAASVTTPESEREGCFNSPFSVAFDLRRLLRGRGRGGGGVCPELDEGSLPGKRGEGFDAVGGEGAPRHSFKNAQKNRRRPSTPPAVFEFPSMSRFR